MILRWVATGILSCTTAQVPDAALSPDIAASAACCTIPALSPLEIEILETMNSQANKPGDKFALRLATPLVVDGRVLIPAGATGSGDVVHAAKSRFGGKAGEMILAARYIEYGGVRIPLRSLRPVAAGQGKDNTETAAIVGIAVAPVLSMFITGGEVNVTAGTIMTAKVSAATVVTVPEPVTN